MVVAIPLSWYVCFSADNWCCERGCDCYPFGSRYFLNFQTDLRLPKPGGHNPEGANKPRPAFLRTSLLLDIRYQKGKLNVIKRKNMSFLGLKVLLTAL